MNDREFKKHLQAISRGEAPAEREGQILEQEPAVQRQRRPKKQPAQKSLPPNPSNPRRSWGRCA